METFEVDAAVHDLRLATSVRDLRLEFAAEVVGDRDHGSRPAYDEARGGADAGHCADVAHVLPVSGDDERGV